MSKKTIEDLVEENDPVEVDEPEVVVEKVMDPPAKRESRHVRAVEGDSYLSIAEKMGATGRAARDLAMKIMELNGSAPVRPGKMIFLPKGN